MNRDEHEQEQERVQDREGGTEDQPGGGHPAALLGAPRAVDLAAAEDAEDHRRQAEAELPERERDDRERVGRGDLERNSESRSNSWV